MPTGALISRFRNSAIDMTITENENCSANEMDQFPPLSVLLFFLTKQEQKVLAEQDVGF